MHASKTGRRWTAALLLMIGAVGPASLGLEVEVDSARYLDPKIELPPPITYFRPELKPLWLEALAHPEADLQRQAAAPIAEAHEQGMPGLADAAAPLMETLDAPDQHPVVTLACAQALIALDARQAAPLLFEHAVRDGLEMAQLVEPALARWDYAPIREVWLTRLAAARTPRRRLVLAIRGVQTVQEPQAAPRLRELALGRDVAPDVRLEAARALGTIRTDGLEEDARSLATDKSPERILDRLVGASLLNRHEGEAAEAVLLDLAVDAEPTVAAIALARLLEIDFMLVIPEIAKTSIANEDPNVRRLGARGLVAWRTPEAIGSLGPMLDDPHPEVRRYVRRSLTEMASDAELDDSVLHEALQMLGTERWRGLEQASLIVVAMDHKPAADRLVELLEFERPEVFITAAWALRRLAVPETLEPMFEKFERETDVFKAGRWDGNVAEQLCHLAEAFGQMKYMPADSLLREHIPKNAPFSEGMRGAAIWALGHLYAGQPQADLVRLLSERLADVFGMIPEDEEVRCMSAISLGRMKAEDALPTLRQFYKMDTINSPVGYGCAWAIHQITGEPMEEPQAFVIRPMNWFLVPAD